MDHIGLKDLCEAVQCTVPCPYDGPCGVIISSVQSTSQTNFLPLVCLAFMLITVVQGAQQSIIGNNDTIHTQCTWPSVNRKVNIIFLSFLYAIHLRENRIARHIHLHLSPFSILSPAILKLLPISAQNILLGVPSLFHILFSLRQVFLKEETEPLSRWLVLYGECSEECSHKGAQISQRIVMSYPSRLDGNLHQHLHVIVEVEADAGSSHGGTTASRMFFKTKPHPVRSILLQSISPANACTSWRPSAHIVHAPLVILGNIGANLFEGGVRL